MFVSVTQSVFNVSARKRRIEADTLWSRWIWRIRTSVPVVGGKAGAARGPDHSLCSCLGSLLEMSVQLSAGAASNIALLFEPRTRPLACYRVSWRLACARGEDAVIQRDVCKCPTANHRAHTGPRSLFLLVFKVFKSTCSLDMNSAVLGVRLTEYHAGSHVTNIQTET